MILDQEIVSDLLALAKGGINPIIIAEEDNFILKKFLFDLTEKVNCWDLVANEFIFHSDLKSYITEELADQYYFENVSNHTRIMRMWGANINFTKFIPSNNIISLSYYKTSIGGPDRSRGIALGIIDFDKIKRKNNLKSFW